MKDGINPALVTHKKEDVIQKGTMAGNQQAFRGRPINEARLQKKANQFGQFAQDYCNAYRSEHARIGLKTLGEQVKNQAHHCARRQFNYKGRNNIHTHPELKKISKLAEKHENYSNYFTICYIQHYNKLLEESGQPIPDSLLMPSFQRKATTVEFPPANTESSIEPAGGLTNSADEITLINLLADLKKPDNFVPDMIIEVPNRPPVIFSSTSLTSSTSICSNVIDLYTDDCLENPQRVSNSFK